MKSNILILLILFLMNVLVVKAQKLETIEIPTMPAATIIGTQINEVHKPKSLKAFESAILNNFIDSNNKAIIPQNYAFEINPYLLSKRTNFNYASYLENKIGDNIIRNFSVSVASTDKFYVNDTINSNALGIGIRTIILNGNVDGDVKVLYEKSLATYQEALNNQSKIATMIGFLSKDPNMNLDSILNKILNEKWVIASSGAEKIIKNVFKSLDPNLKGDAIKDSFIENYKKQASLVALEDFKIKLNEIQTNRYGWRWEVEAALALSFPTNNFEYSISPKQGIWTNITYRPSKKKQSIFKAGENIRNSGKIEFTGMVRWLNFNDAFIDKFHPSNAAPYGTGSNFDVGIRTTYLYEKFSIGLEYVYRWNRNREFIEIDGAEYSRPIIADTDKFIFNLNYLVSDNVILTYNIGKNYDLINHTKGNFISGFSINFGINGQKNEVLKE